MFRTAIHRGRPVVAVIVVAMAAAFIAPATAGPVVHGYALGRGTRLQTIRLPKYPEEIRVAIVKPGHDVPDIQPADGAYPLWALTSTMSATAGAIVGVNGDFGTSTGQPKHVMMVDGELWTTGQSGGNAVAWSANGKRAYVGHPALKILGSDAAAHALFFVADWNVGAPRQGSIAAYTSRGGTVTRPPGVANPRATDPQWCAARLEPSAGVRWNGTRETSLIRRYTVTVQKQPCPKTRLPIGSKAGAVVLAKKFKPGVRNKVRGLDVGDRVKIAMTLRGWPGATDVMGGQQVLVEKGANVAPAYKPGDAHILDYNPRTAVGITKGCSDADTATTCKLILITVDGRQASTNWSMGVRLPMLGKLLRDQGAWMAVNLDGGGSTAMWVKRRDTYCESKPSVGGCLVERPFGSFQRERVTRSAIVILPSADGGTPAALR
jgi:hypothetical protein